MVSVDEDIRRQIDRLARDKAALLAVLAAEETALARVRAILAYHRQNERRNDPLIGAFLMELADVVSALEARVRHLEAADEP